MHLKLYRNSSISYFKGCTQIVPGNSICNTFDWGKHLGYVMYLERHNGFQNLMAQGQNTDEMYLRLYRKTSIKIVPSDSIYNTFDWGKHLGYVMYHERHNGFQNLMAQGT